MGLYWRISYIGSQLGAGSFSRRRGGRGPHRGRHSFALWALAPVLRPEAEFCGRYGYAFGERCLADKGAHEFAAREVERQLEFGKTGDRGCFHRGRQLHQVKVLVVAL